MSETNTRKVKKRAGTVIHGAVSEHAAEKAKQIRAKYGPTINYQVLLGILGDRESIRHPVKIEFTSKEIEPGMFAKTESVSEDPTEGYTVFLHEQFRYREEVLPALILYQTVIANYGDLATAIDAEIFGAGVLGMDRDEYYELICESADSIWDVH